VHDLPGARGLAGLLLTTLLAGCGGGSGTDEATRTEISTNAITFSAAAPDAATPDAQVFTATFGSDIAHLAVVHSGTAISSVISTLNGRMATITVQPAAPSSIGPGPFVGAVAVTGYTCADATCTKLAAGDTSTVAVNYQVSPVVDLVTPYVATAGVPDVVALRGLGFRAFNTQTVRFGDTAATAIAINTTGTEVRATYPALPAGTYTVRVEATDHQGPIPSTATLVVVDPIGSPPTILQYPTSATVLRNLIYDAERRALFVVTDAAGGSIVRYTYAGGAWGAPVEVAGGFRDVALSIDGTMLYAITSTTLVPIDPVTLALGTAITAPSLATNAYLKNIVVGNDNVGLITTGIDASTATASYLYTPRTAALILGGTLINNGTPTMSGLGANAYIIQGDPTLTADVIVYKYATASNALGTSVISLRQNTVAPVYARNENRVVLNGQRVYDANDALLGTLPASTVAVALKPDGTRAYAFDTTAGGILTYDISVDRDEAAYVALGPVTPLTDPGNVPRMIISPDGGTLFLAGNGRVVVVPTPAL
jgi:hypothetical protein